jgi:hypothetical protein
MAPEDFAAQLAGKAKHRAGVHMSSPDEIVNGFIFGNVGTITPC